MADLTEPAKRLKVFSMRYMAINVGVAVGPLLGAFFATMNGALPFLITGIIYFIYAVTLYALLIKFGIKKIEGEKKSSVTFGSALGVIRSDLTFRLYILGGIIGAIGYSQVMVTLSQYLGAELCKRCENVCDSYERQCDRGHCHADSTYAFGGKVLTSCGDYIWKPDVCIRRCWFCILPLAGMAYYFDGDFHFWRDLNYPAANMLIDKLSS